MTTLAGLPAHKIVFIDAGLQKMQVWTIKDDRIFTITYEADAGRGSSGFIEMFTPSVRAPVGELGTRG